MMEESNAIEEYKKAQEEFFEKQENERKKKELVKCWILVLKAVVYLLAILNCQSYKLKMISFPF